MTIRKYIPNTITSLNLLSGTIAVMMAYEGNWKLVVLFVLLSALFDFCDGFTARLLKVSSPIGKELDSLADLISFGFVPGMTAYTLLQNSEWPITRYAGLLIVAFSALRLAKFNLDERQTNSFIGLATPANAIFWIGLAYSYNRLLVDCAWLILLLIVISCILLVCEIPMFSLKIKHLGWKGNETRIIFLVGVIILALLLKTKSLPAIIVWYLALVACNMLKNKLTSPKNE